MDEGGAIQYHENGTGTGGRVYPNLSISNVAMTNAPKAALPWIAIVTVGSPWSAHIMHWPPSPPPKYP